MSERITQPGYYDVSLYDCGIQEKEDGTGFAYVLNGRTEDGQTITAFEHCSSKIITGGKFAGKTRYEAALETLRDVGMNPSDPTDVESLNGKACNFNVQWDDYWNERNPDKEPRVAVAFVNPPRQLVKKEDRRAMFAKLGFLNESQPAARSTPAPATPAVDDSDVEDIPF